jgi:glycosyltransferase involved in cell wall biosynthesis
MKKKHKQRKNSPSRVKSGCRTLYHQARQCARNGLTAQARSLYDSLVASVSDPHLKALVLNDRAALDAAAGQLDRAQTGFEQSLLADPACEAARLNLALIQADLAPSPQPCQVPLAIARPPAFPRQLAPVKVAIVSFLFNWPSTGGGIVHTVELAQFLSRAGFQVQHFHARFAPWGIGGVEAPLPFVSEALEFSEADWNLPSIQRRFRQAVDAFAPDFVLITDSWSMKPLLAEALEGYRILLRLQAMECLCPLNNVRLLPEPEGRFRQCTFNLLDSPSECAQCLRTRGQFSGSLHQAERTLSGAGTPEYHQKLLRALCNAEGVLVVNSLTAGMVQPHARSVRIVTAGMDPARFPWPAPENAVRPEKRVRTILFAGLVEEWMKGFHVLHEACRLLWSRRQDFELVATADPPGRIDEFTRFVGWQSQQNLPRQLWAADLLALPTIAQEGLGRTAVEAMAAGKPVIASRLGGLTDTVVDGVTGLLFNPGDVNDLLIQIERLLDSPELCRKMGQAGRERFEQHYDWNVIIERHYRPLLSAPQTFPPVIPYAPRISPQVDRQQLLEEAEQFFTISRSQVAELFESYRVLHETRNHAEILGEYKTLCFEEAFILHVHLSIARPTSVVVIGAEDGKSVRRLLDSKEALGLNCRMACFDTVDRVRFFNRQEAELLIRNLSGNFRREVLEAFPPGLLFLDVHTYDLLREVLSETLAHSGKWTVAIHDSGRGLCNPHMTLARTDPNVTSLTGVWERHVLAELFGVDDPLDPRLDHRETAGHRLHIFDTPHGLALILPK